MKHEVFEKNSILLLVGILEPGSKQSLLVGIMTALLQAAESRVRDADMAQEQQLEQSVKKERQLETEAQKLMTQMRSKQAMPQPDQKTRPQQEQSEGQDTQELVQKSLAMARLEGQIKTPADLETAAKANGLTVQETGFFARDEPILGVGASPEMSARAFTLDDGEAEVFARSALVLKYDEPGKTLPITESQILQPRRFDDNHADLWSTFNRVQENLVKGGLTGRSANGRQQRTRPVQGIDQNVRLNRAL